MSMSQNGYAANDRSLIETFTVPGTDVRIPLRKGDAGWVLAYVAARFHREVEPLNPAGQQWCWGYAARNVRGSTTVVSNHASGTAEDLNAPVHPRGVRGTFTAAKVRAVRRILDDLVDEVTGRHVVRWGEDYTAAPVDGMHFEVNADAAAVSRVAARLRAEQAAKDRAAADAAKAAAEQAAKDAAAAAAAAEMETRIGDVMLFLTFGARRFVLVGGTLVNCQTSTEFSELARLYTAQTGRKAITQEASAALLAHFGFTEDAPAPPSPTA